MAVKPVQISDLFTENACCNWSPYAHKHIQSSIYSYCDRAANYHFITIFKIYLGIYTALITIISLHLSPLTLSDYSYIATLVPPKQYEWLRSKTIRTTLSKATSEIAPVILCLPRFYFTHEVCIQTKALIWMPRLNLHTAAGRFNGSASCTQPSEVLFCFFYMHQILQVTKWRSKIVGAILKRQGKEIWLPAVDFWKHSAPISEPQ